MIFTKDEIDFQSDAFYNKNPSFSSTNHIIEFTLPLKNLDIDYFTFDRHYSDGSRIALTNTADWIIHYWRTELFKDAIFEHASASFSTGHVFWNWLNREPIYAKAAEFGIDNGVTLTEQCGEYCDFFHFGSIHHNRINNEFLARRLPLLQQFCSLFKHKLHDLIEHVSKDKIKLPSYMQQPISNHQIDTDKLLSDWSSIMEKRDIARIYLGGDYNNQYLTRSEFSLLQQLTKGNSGAGAANKLNISTDAVNKHIRNIKERLGCKSLFQLGFMMGKLNARNLFPFLINKEN